jgi:hypothetical protein
MVTTRPIEQTRKLGELHMNTTRIDRISTAFATRKLSRRQTLTTGASGIAAGTLAATGVDHAGVAQDATPAIDTPAPDADYGPEMLFVQTFQAGTITPVDGVDGRYQLFLEAGTGQTVYFSDRPDRVVGATPTPQFLAGLGFPADNPPNAALVVETAPGESDVAVVELFNPIYDPLTQGVTYEVSVLANWQQELEVGLQEAPTDLAALAPSFGAAQLFIDDCPDARMFCYTWRVTGYIESSEHDGYCYSWARWGCFPCQPWDPWNAEDHWAIQCNQRFEDCQHSCQAGNICSKGAGRECAKL